MKLSKPYCIPFRCFYSRNIPHLMMARRCFSCSHVGIAEEDGDLIDLFLVKTGAAEP
ncbi:MAG: hypothetical protein WED15_07770 [Akkermansiaceae bacterium]